MERRLAAVFAADVVGYSRMVRNDESGTVTALRAVLGEVVEPAICRRRGRVVKLMGDGVLAEFASAVEAVETAVEIQRAMSKRDTALEEDRRITFRIGINLGDVIIDGEDIQGDGVNVAARLESTAEPGAVCVSDAVHEQVRDRLDEVFADLGPRQLKNIDRPVQIWQWTDALRRPIGERTATARREADKPSIAVLPFNNMSGDREQEYFSDGITEDIITEISKIDGLLVISRNSTFAFKGRAAKVRDICRELGVRYILEGSVRKVGPRVRISAQLIDGQSDTHMWAQRYDRDLTDVFAVQDEVTAEIALALEVEFSAFADGASARKETENIEAYDLVLRGREQFKLYTTEANRHARDLFEKARSLDPEYATAHAALALVSMHEWILGRADGLDEAYDHALKACAVDPTLPAVYEALASVQLFRRQHDASIAAARKWIEVEPGNAEAYICLAGSLLYSGESEKVLPLVEKAIRMNPFYPFYYIFYRGKALFAMGRFSEALEDMDRCISRNPENLPPRIYRVACLGHLRRNHEAKTALADVQRMSPGMKTGIVRTIFAFRREEDVKLLVDGLTAAGMSNA